MATVFAAEVANLVVTGRTESAGGEVEATIRAAGG